MVMRPPVFFMRSFRLLRFLTVVSESARKFFSGEFHGEHEIAPAVDIVHGDEPADRVYQMNFQIFPVSVLPKKGKRS